MNFIGHTSLPTPNVGVSLKRSHNVVRIAVVDCYGRTACCCPSKGEVAISRHLILIERSCLHALEWKNNFMEQIPRRVLSKACDFAALTKFSI